MSIEVSFDEYSEPFCRVKNLRRITEENPLPSYWTGGAYPVSSSVITITSSSPSIYPSQPKSSEDRYVFEMLDGKIYKLNEEEIHLLIQQLFNDVSFEDALSVIGI